MYYAVIYRENFVFKHLCQGICQGDQGWVKDMPEKKPSNVTKVLENTTTFQKAQQHVVQISVILLCLL